MEKSTAPKVPLSSYLLVAVILMIAGWAGLLFVTNYTTPNGGTRWLFFFALVIAVTGTVLPIVAFLNQRFPPQPPPTPIVIARQSLWFGVYVATLAWLQLGRVVNIYIAVLLAVGLVIIEWLLRLRERSQWKP